MDLQRYFTNMLDQIREINIKMEKKKLVSKAK